MASIKQRAASLAAGTEGRATGIRSQLTARERRLEQSLVQDLAEVLPRNRSHPTLAPEQARGGIPAARGRVQRNYQPGSSTGTGGIASPLIEGAQADADPENPSTPVLARESYPVQQLTSSDGLFVWEVTPPSKVTFRDANGEAAEFRLANPYAEEEEA